MPPKAASVDGILSSATPNGTASPTSTAVNEDLKKELQNQAAPPMKHSAALIEEIKKEKQLLPAATNKDSKSNTKSQVKTSKNSSGPAVAVLMTLIIMVLLIGLAFFAYNKSR